MKIVTTYKSNANGTGQIVAKGGGKQRTTNYQHEYGPRANHIAAAFALAKALGLPMLPRTENVELDNGKATFWLP